jgi:hypothetical protein
LKKNNVNAKKLVNHTTWPNDDATCFLVKLRNSELLLSKPRGPVRELKMNFLKQMIE